jgi:excisionase family DNA binding protein
MFYTLQEAARRLRISEEQLETMLQRGLLREFREGPHRLLKAADVAILARSLTASRPSPGTVPREPSPPASDHKLKLPHRAAAAVKTPGPGLPGSRVVGQAHQRKMPGAERRGRRYGTNGGRQRTERLTALHYRPSACPAPLSVRQWLWNGLTQDRPIAILVLFGLVLLTLGAMVAGVCLLVEVL